MLAVDDNQDNLDMLDALLCGVGFQVLCNNDPKAALEQALLVQPDVILLDLVMPVISGTDFIERYRAEPGGQKVPIIVITASALGGDRERALELGANDFLHKPVSDEELFDAIANQLNIAYTRQGVSTEAPDTGTSQGSEEDVYFLEEELAYKLREAAHTSDITALQAAITEVHARQPLLANQLTKLMDEFNYDGLTELLDKTSHEAFGSSQP